MAEPMARAAAKPTVASQREPAASKKPGAAAPVVAPAANVGLGRLYNAGPAFGLAPSLQYKVVVGPPDDPFEQEADRVAERVTAGGPVMRIARLPSHGFARPSQRLPNKGQETPARTRAVQRQTTEEKEEQAQTFAVQRQVGQEEELLQSKTEGGPPTRSTGIPAVSSRTAATIRSPGAGQPIAPALRSRIEPHVAADLGGVRVHTGLHAQHAAASLQARAFTHRQHIFLGRDESPANLRLMAHEATHVVQQGAAEPAATSPGASVVMRDLALEPPADVPEQGELTVAQVQAGLRYNRASYDRESTSLIQDIVGAEQTGSFDEDTVRLVALIQRQYGLVPADGKVGPDTYDFLIRELQAEGVAPGACLTLFQIVGPQPLQFFRTSSTRGVINSRFEIHARFDPRCNCGDYEYRQYIGGHVELLETAQPGVTPPATSGCAVLDSVLPGIWVWNMDRCFQIPGGGLTRRMKEDGDVAVPAGVAGQRYGHRSARPNPADGRDVYSPDRATGCIYEGFDVPELSPVPATPGDSGDVYDWDMRFRGVIQRSDGTIVAEKWWNIIRTVTIP